MPMLTCHVLPHCLAGTHNGDVHSHVPNSSPWHTAYHGLVRAVVRVTGTAGRPAAERALLAKIDAHGPLSAAGQAGSSDSADAIVVEATLPGFAPARISIPVSTDAAAAGVMAAASATAGMPVNFFG